MGPHCILFRSLPLYFQILGSSATMSGVRMMPFSLLSAIVAIIAGQIVARTKKYRPVIWFGFVSLLGYWIALGFADLGC